MSAITKLSTVFVLLFSLVDLTPAALIPEESDAFNGKAAAEFSLQTIQGDQSRSQKLQRSSDAVEFLRQLVSAVSRRN